MNAFIKLSKGDDGARPSHLLCREYIYRVDRYSCRESDGSEISGCVIYFKDGTKMWVPHNIEMLDILLNPVDPYFTQKYAAEYIRYQESIDKEKL